MHPWHTAKHIVNASSVRRVQGKQAKSARVVTFAPQILMKALLRYSFFSAITLSVMHTAIGQCNPDSLKKFTPPQNRARWHDDIDREQKNILKWDGKDDNKLFISENDEINYRATRAATFTIDCFQYRIENDSTLGGQKKVGYLRWYAELLRNLQKDWSVKNKAERVKLTRPAALPQMLEAYEKAMQLERNGGSLLELVKGWDYATAAAIMKLSAFDNNREMKACQAELVRKYCIMFPEKTLATLQQTPEVPFADSLIKLVARNNPKELYDYAQADNKLGNVIRGIKDDPFIVTVCQMARSKDGQQYFCFLDNILKGKLTFAQVDSAKTDSLRYYRLLVKTHLDYVARVQNRDTAFEYETLNRRMEKKAKENFVDNINRLHEEKSPEVRFNCIKDLTPEELYYLAVLSDGSIYTSSFVRGVFPLMMKKINNRGDSLLMQVRFDKYRKLIKMCAGFNKLDEFLGSFPPARSPGEVSDAEILMTSFVKNLEKGNGTEDAVDVADSYASIAETLKPLADEMLKNVQENYSKSEAAQNKKGMAIYKILKYLFLSADSTKKIDLTKELGIPPVYTVPYSALKNDSGRVVIQQFFYGDKDGQGVFNGFVKMFSNSNWKLISTDQWVEARSVKGKPVSIFSNRALNENDGLDAAAQKALCDYLEKNNLQPAVTIHRGHSYYADATVEQLFPTSKIVFMGSCGGYRLLHDILSVSDDAHIVATKQIGDTKVNNPFVRLVAEKARSGQDIQWIPFWEELRKEANSPEFEDYMPPYKNLGALFIKAFKIAMSEE